MKKIHTPVKRRFKLSTHSRHYSFINRVKRKNRPKTFTTEKAAHEYALKNNLKKEEYFLKKTKHNKKFQIVHYNKKNKEVYS